MTVCQAGQSRLVQFQVLSPPRFYDRRTYFVSLLCRRFRFLRRVCVMFKIFLAKPGTGPDC